MYLVKKIHKLFKLSRFKLWRKGLLNGIAATIELENMIRSINPETIVDIGSNKGQFILLIEQLFPNRIIHSFEPLLEVLEIQRKFFNYNKNIFFYNFALGRTSSVKKFFITKRKDSSSFFKMTGFGRQLNDYQIDNEKDIQIKSLDQILNGQENLEFSTNFIVFYSVLCF